MDRRSSTAEPSLELRSSSQGDLWPNLGRRGEDAALRFLIAAGMKLEQRNWSCRLGEIDLIFRDGSDLVFVEVKARSFSLKTNRYLFDSITFAKRRKLRLLAEIYCKRHAPCHAGIRIDVVGVLLDKDTVRQIRHLRAAVTVE